MKIEAVEVALSLQCAQWERSLPEVQRIVQRACKQALAGMEDDDSDVQTPIEVSVVLADDDFVRDLNHTYRGKDSATNILSFPTDAATEEGGVMLLGDLALAFETVQREADEQGKTLADHVSHLLVHGCLHLLGLDHEEDEEAEAMEELEVAILKEMGIADPYEICDVRG